MHSVQSLNFDKSFTEKEKPISKKELQKKYTDKETEQFLEDGGVVPVKHSNKNSSLQVYVDKRNGGRQKKVSKVTNLRRTNREKLKRTK